MTFDALVDHVQALVAAIERLAAYRDAGADCVDAPGLRTVEQVRTVVDALGVPVNVLALPGGPSVSELDEVGCTRMSTGGSLASTAYGALMSGARELIGSGTSSYLSIGLGSDDRRAAFDTVDEH